MGSADLVRVGVHQRPADVAASQSLTVGVQLAADVLDRLRAPAGSSGSSRSNKRLDRHGKDLPRGGDQPTRVPRRAHPPRAPPVIMDFRALPPGDHGVVCGSPPKTAHNSMITERSTGQGTSPVVHSARLVAPLCWSGEIGCLGAHDHRPSRPRQARRRAGGRGVHGAVRRARGESANDPARCSTGTSGGWCAAVSDDVSGQAVGSLPLPGTPPARSSAALLVFGPDAVSVGTSALALLEIAGLPRLVTPEAALPGGRSALSRDRLALRQFDAGMVCIPAGRTPCRSAGMGAGRGGPRAGPRRRRRGHGLGAEHGQLTAIGLARAHDLARHRRGVHRTHEWWELSDGRAESPLETFGRLDCVDGGVPPDELQVRIHDAGGVLLGDGDLAVAAADGPVVDRRDGRSRGP